VATVELDEVRIIVNVSLRAGRWIGRRVLASTS
jgi:hypothetical protein